LSQDFFGQEKLLPRLFLLTLLKEGYLLLANSYGFLFHPYLTLKKISRDRSQMAIFASLWMGGWLGILILGIFAILIYYFFPQFSLLKKLSLALGVLGGIFLSLFTGYLLYWIVIFFKKRNA
jgi:hypothetical protein